MKARVSYSPELADEICRRLAEGESLRAICRDDGMPRNSAVVEWARLNLHGFSEQYARARELQAEHWAEEILEISDDGTNDWVQRENNRGDLAMLPDHEHIARSKLRVDTRRWLLSKILAKKYGDKIVQEHVGPDGGPVVMTLEERRAATKQAFAEAFEEPKRES